MADRTDGQLQGVGRSFEGQAPTPDGGQLLTPTDEHDFIPPLEQPPADGPADTTRAVNGVPHRDLPCRSTHWRVMDGKLAERTMTEGTERAPRPGVHLEEGAPGPSLCADTEELVPRPRPEGQPGQTACADQDIFRLSFRHSFLLISHEK